jgi:DNA replication protein DnaC
MNRQEKQLAKRYRWALLPEIKTLDEFNLEEQQSLSKRQLNQLRELLWLEQNYNLIFLGPRCRENTPCNRSCGSLEKGL